MLTMGVVSSSRKENENRVAIHPDHVSRIPEDLRRHLVFEKGYGAPFGMSDATLLDKGGRLAGRMELFETSDIALLPKPVIQDLEEIGDGGIVWGWPHCVQHRALTQIAIDHKQTIIAFEDMFVWDPDGRVGRHTFYKNNELAGYCAVLHALQLRGTDGHYGRQRKVVILSFGAVSRGAIYALKARGLRDITICIQRQDQLVREEVLGCHYLRIRSGENGEPRLVAVEHDGSEFPLLDLLCDADVIINGTFQDPNSPITFVTKDETSRLKAGGLIVDVSCDEGMGFPFARPTTFDEPMFKVGALDYYGVDHTPSYLWESASWEISLALLRYLPVVMAGPEAWKGDETISQAIDILEGVVQKPDILSFQNRANDYPHAITQD